MFLAAVATAVAVADAEVAFAVLVADLRGGRGIARNVRALVERRRRERMRVHRGLLRRGAGGRCAERASRVRAADARAQSHRTNGTGRTTHAFAAPRASRRLRGLAGFERGGRCLEKSPQPQVAMMKTMMLVLALALSLAGCGRGGGDTAEKVFADMTSNMHEMSAILASVTDEASARAAVPRIDAVRAKMRECATRARAVPKPDAATEQRLDAAAEAMQREVMPAVMAERQRLQSRPDLLAILAPSLQGMENDL
jgi:hypothetical protein